MVTPSRLVPGVEGSGNDFRHHMARHVRESEIATIVVVSELFVVEAKQVENRRVQIVHVDLVLDGMMTEFIRLAMNRTGLDATAGQPDGETTRIVVATGAVLLGVRRAAK